MTDRVVVVGASVGGVRVAQALRAAAFDREVVVVGAERQMPYDKPPLSKDMLTGERTAADIRLTDCAALAEAGISLRLGTAASGLDVARRRIELADGETLDYGRLVIATGVRPRILSRTADLSLVQTVRTLDDSERLRRRLLASGGPLVVVGGGFVGAEVAASASKLGVQSTIVEASPAPFSRVFGEEVGTVVARLHTEQGVEVISGQSVTGIEQLGSSVGVVHLADGRSLSATTVVTGIGCLPNTEWLEGSTLEIDDGIVTDEFCRARGADDVYAIGDVARWFDLRSQTQRRTEHWTNAFQQAQLVSHNLLNPEDLRPHTRAPYFWSDQHDVKIQMVGVCSPNDDVEIVRVTTPHGERDVAMYACNDALTAAVVFGWPQVLPQLRRAWEQEASRDQVRTILNAAAA